MDKKIGIIVSVVSIVILIGGIYLLSQPGTTAPVVKDRALLIGDGRNTKGNPNAKVTLVEIADFECPACAVAHPLIKSLFDAHKDEIYFVYRHFPLSQHKNAYSAASASEAASEQGKFWEIYDILYEKQKEWDSETKPLDKFIQYAKDLGLDIEKFKKDIEEDKFKELIQKDLDDGFKIGVNATPTFFINGEQFEGSFDQLKTKIEEKLKSTNLQNNKETKMEQTKKYNAYPEMIINEDKEYTVNLETTKGNIKIKLFTKEVPKTVNNFVFLARDGFYNGTEFHRIIKGFMIQGGDPLGNGTGGPGYQFADEKVARDYKRGIIAMANSGSNTNGSQFFIMHQDYSLPKSYTIFGEVIEGIETVDKIAEIPTTAGLGGENSTPTEAVKITKVTVDEN